MLLRWRSRLKSKPRSLRTAIDRWSLSGHNRSVDIAAQIVNNPLYTPAPSGAILHPNEP